MSDNFRDLFGEVLQPKRGRGRPAHVPTRDNRSKVARLLVAGCPKVEIARSLEITMPTLRRHYLRTKTERKSQCQNIAPEDS